MNRMRMMIGVVGSLTLVSGIQLVGGDLQQRIASREQLMQHFAVAAGREGFKVFLPVIKENVLKITVAANTFNRELSDQEKDKLLLKLFEIAMVNKIKEHELPPAQKSIMILRALYVVNNAADVMGHYVMVKGAADPFDYMERYIDEKLAQAHGDSFVGLKAEVARHNKKLKADAARQENSDMQKRAAHQPGNYTFSKLAH